MQYDDILASLQADILHDEASDRGHNVAKHPPHTGNQGRGTFE